VRPWRWSRVVAWLLVLLAAPAFARELPDFTELVERQGVAVVNISSTQLRGRDTPFPGIDENDPMFDFFRRFIPRHPKIPRQDEDDRSLGSGFIVSPEGYILTNAHVVESASEILVRLADKREFAARVVGSDKRTDVALIKIEAAGLPKVTLGDPSRLKVGEWVVAIGSPFGFEQTVTAGIVSAKGRSLPQENLVPFIQTDVAINPGNSGGPLFNMKGEVVGINSQIYSRTGGFMGLSFAIPIDVAMDVQARLRQDGRIQRGRIGVAIQEVTRELAEGFGLSRPEGALVSAVEPASPADKAGIQQGDVILRFDSKAVVASVDLPRIVGATRPGSRVAVQVWRRGDMKELALSVGELKEEGAGKPLPRPSSREAAPNRLGLVLVDPTPEQRRQMDVQGGVLVEQARGPAARAELRQGDVILAVVSGGRQMPVKSVEQFNQLIASQGKAKVVTLLVSRGPLPNFVSLRMEE
jgi:serine protease Do